MAAFVERWVFQTSVLVRMTFLNKIPLQISFSKNWTMKETNISGQGTFAQKKKSHHSSVSVGCVDWLLLFLRSDATTAAWIDGKAVIPNSSRLSHRISKIPSSTWKIQASNKIVLFGMLRTDHQTQTALTLHISLSQNRPITLYISSLQDNHLSIKRYGMKRSTSCTFAVLLHPTTTLLARIFF